MPTATTISQYSLTNWGPLTTTFPADPCETGAITWYVLKTAPGFGLTSACNVPVVNPSCYPSASQLNSVESSVWNTVGRFVMGYFSPGLVCPSGWKTVGIAARGSDGSISADGIFVSPTPAPSSGAQQGPTFNPAMNAFTAALDSGETAAACCPSSMTALTDGVCYSTLPDYKITTICERIIPTDVLGSVTTDLTFLGVHTTAVLQTWATKTGGGAPVAVTTTLEAAQHESHVGAKQIPMVMLVKKGGDGAGGGDGGGGSKPNAAGGGGAGGAIAGAQLAIVTCVSAVLLGVGIIFWS